MLKIAKFNQKIYLQTLMTRKGVVKNDVIAFLRCFEEYPYDIPIRYDSTVIFVMDCDKEFIFRRINPKHFPNAQRIYFLSVPDRHTLNTFSNTEFFLSEESKALAFVSEYNEGNYKFDDQVQYIPQREIWNKIREAKADQIVVE